MKNKAVKKSTKTSLKLPKLKLEGYVRSLDVELETQYYPTFPKVTIDLGSGSKLVFPITDGTKLNDIKKLAGIRVQVTLEDSGKF